MSSFTECSRTLNRGQIWHQKLAAGTTLVAVRGKVSLLMPAIWLEGQFHQAAIGLAEGEAYVMPDNGWLVIIAQTDAELVLQGRESILSMSARKLLDMLRRCHALLKRDAPPSRTPAMRRPAGEGL